MNISVITMTTPHLSFPECLELYARAGVPGVGIIESMLTGDEGELEAFRRSGLVTTSVIPVTATFFPSPGVPGPEDLDERLDAISAAMRRTAPFNPVCFTVATGPLGGRTREEARPIVVEAIARLAEEADALGSTLALELMHPMLHELFSYLTALEEGVALLDESGSSTAGLAVDFWHLAEEPDAVADLERHAGRIATMHVDDFREPTRSWVDRVLPGDGTLDIAGMLAALDRGGYTGWFELEILSDDGLFGNDFEDSLWKRDPFELVRDAKAKLLELGAA